MGNVQGKMPALLSLVLQGTVIGLAVYKLGQWEGVARIVGIALVVLYILWLLIEMRVAVGEVAKDHTNLDRGTLELYAFGRAATVITAFLVPADPPNIRMLAFGFVLFVFSVGLRLLAIHTLGRYYSHRVRIVGEHRIIDSGPYRFVRHPSYTGMFFAHVGFALVFFNWLTACVVVGVLLPGIVLRIRVEERVLLSSIPEYARYSGSRKRLVPLVW